MPPNPLLAPPRGDVSIIIPTEIYDRALISCQSGANVALTRESPDGTYLTYFPFGLWTEASQERRYHKKFTRNYYAKSTTSSASDALIYDAASVIFLVAYFTKILVGLRYSASHSAAWRSIMCDIMM